MRGRDFTLLWSASAASQTGSMCLAAANPLLALLLTHSPVVAGWVGAAGTIPALLMQLPAGWFVDRCNRRLLMFIGQTGRLTACFLPVCAIVFDYHPTALLILGAFFEGVFLVLYNAAEITAVQRVVDSAELPSALATNEARGHLALMAGKPLGGFLFSLDRTLPYFFGIVASAVSIQALISMKKKDYQPREADGSPVRAGARTPRAPFLGSLRFVLLSPFLRTVIVVCAVGNFFFQTVVLLLVVLAEQRHMSGTEIGLLLASSGVGGLIGSVVAPKVGKRFRQERNIIVFCVVVWLALIAIVAGTVHPVAGLLAWGGLSVTGGFLNVAIINHQTGRVPEHMLGRVMAVNRFVTGGAVPLGALSAGYIIAEFRPDGAALLVFCVIAALCLAVPVLLRPRRMLPDRTVDRLKYRISLPKTLQEVPVIPAVPALPTVPALPAVPEVPAVHAPPVAPAIPAASMVPADFVIPAAFIIPAGFAIPPAYAIPTVPTAPAPAMAAVRAVTIVRVTAILPMAFGAPTVTIIRITVVFPMGFGVPALPIVDVIRIRATSALEVRRSLAVPETVHERRLKPLPAH
ncbi:MFS transporter [Actinomadura chokoriensis]|uniref:MFS transporter n=1 Tax=Actinomadura chokoriensis TaxID=454156 RepID=UPI0031F7E70A